MSETAVGHVRDVAVASIPGKTCSLLLIADCLGLLFRHHLSYPTVAAYLPKSSSSFPLCLLASQPPTRLSTSVRLECVQPFLYNAVLAELLASKLERSPEQASFKTSVMQTTPAIDDPD